MFEHRSEVIKVREIHFMRIHPDPRQAETASLLLTGVDGIDEVLVRSPVHLHVVYRLPQVSLRLLEESLGEIGFHLDNSLLHKMKRALIYYTEETQCANLGCKEGQSNCTRKVFVNRYEKLKHGCRDERPDHWRQYL